AERGVRLRVPVLQLLDLVEKQRVDLGDVRYRILDGRCGAYGELRRRAPAPDLHAQRVRPRGQLRHLKDDGRVARTLRADRRATEGARIGAARKRRAAHRVDQRQRQGAGPTLSQRVALLAVIAVLPWLNQFQRLLPQCKHGVGAFCQRGVGLANFAGGLPAIFLGVDQRAYAAQFLPLFGAKLINQLLQGVERDTLLAARLLLLLLLRQVLVTFINPCLATLHGVIGALLF